MLDDADKQFLRELVASMVTAQPASPIRRMTVQEFALVVGHHPDVINRKIRTRAIHPSLVFGSRPKMISPKALDQFGVTPQEALATLAEHSPSPAPQRSAA